jgi:threonine/homoserine/homoserine lactone efflux protein
MIIWIAFVIASALVVLFSGPNIVLTVTYAIPSGKRSGLATIPGVAVGTVLSMSLSI